MRLSNAYLINKARAVYRSSKPSKTDQSAAQATDINVIMKQFNVTGMVAGSAKPPLYGDYTIAGDLRDMMQITRTLRERHAELPEAIRKLPLKDLMRLPDAELRAILQPAPLEPPKPKEPE